MDADFDRDYYAPIGSIRRAEREAREALFDSALTSVPKQSGKDSANVSADPVFAPQEQGEDCRVYDHENDHPR